MKRVRSDSTDSEESLVSETDIFDDEDIEQVLQDLSQSISKDKALDFLHSLAASKNILYWNSHNEMTYHQRRIPVTNIIELIEYVMQPLNLDVKVPRGLKTFTQGLSEVGIDKKLIRNKRLLADLVARQPEEDQSDSESDSAESSDESYQGDENEEGDETEEETSSDQASESLESESSESDDEPRECHVCRDFKPFYKIPVVQCPRCLWREAYYGRHENQLVECDVCTHVFSVDAHTTKVKFYRCKGCDAVHQLSLKFKKLKLIDDNDDQEESS